MMNHRKRRDAEKIRQGATLIGLGDFIIPPWENTAVDEFLNGERTPANIIFVEGHPVKQFLIANELCYKSSIIFNPAQDTRRESIFPRNIIFVGDLVNDPSPNCAPDKWFDTEKVAEHKTIIVLDSVPAPKATPDKFLIKEKPTGQISLEEARLIIKNGGDIHYSMLEDFFREQRKHETEKAKKVFRSKMSVCPQPKQKPTKPTYTRRAPYGGRYTF